MSYDKQMFRNNPVGTAAVFRCRSAPRRH